MEESKFTYVMEPGDNNGAIDVFKGKIENKRENLLHFTGTSSLIESLKKYRKSIVMVWEEDPDLLQEGKKLAIELGLQFIHP